MILFGQSWFGFTLPNTLCKERKYRACLQLVKFLKQFKFTWNVIKCGGNAFLGHFYVRHHPFKRFNENFRPEAQINLIIRHVWNFGTWFQYFLSLKNYPFLEHCYKKQRQRLVKVRIDKVNSPNLKLKFNHRYGPSKHTHQIALSRFHNLQLLSSTGWLYMRIRPQANMIKKLHAFGGNDWLRNFTAVDAAIFWSSVFIAFHIIADFFTIYGTGSSISQTWIHF